MQIIAKFFSSFSKLSLKKTDYIHYLMRQELVISIYDRLLKTSCYITDKDGHQRKSLWSVPLTWQHHQFGQESSLHGILDSKLSKQDKHVTKKCYCWTCRGTVWLPINLLYWNISQTFWGYKLKRDSTMLKRILEWHSRHRDLTVNSRVYILHFCKLLWCWRQIVTVMDFHSYGNK